MRFSPGSPGVLQAGGNAGDGTEDEVNEEISKMAEMYKMEADKLKDLIGENEMEQMKKDMAVQKAVTLVADAAVEA